MGNVKPAVWILVRHVLRQYSETGIPKAQLIASLPNHRRSEATKRFDEMVNLGLISVEAEGCDDLDAAPCFDGTDVGLKFQRMLRGLRELREQEITDARR